MKLVYENMEHIICFDEGYVNELIVENRRMFFEMVNGISLQADGSEGGFVLSKRENPIEFSKNADVIVQFAPFNLNRKNLLSKLHTYLEQKSLQAEFYEKTTDLLVKLESYIFELAEEMPYDVDCKKIAIGPVIRALSPEFDEFNKTTLEKIFAYMELTRALDRERLFVMVNMRTYFSDEEMQRFVESVVLHDFKVLLLESTSFSALANTKRYVIDEDLCEF